MPAKIPKPTIPINTDSKKIGLLQLGEQLIKNNQGPFQTHKTQNELSVEEKTSKDVQKHLKDYLLAVTKTGCSSSTIRNYRSDINQFLDFADSKDLNDLRNKPKLLAFAHYQRNKGLKENSIKRKLVSITQFKIWLKQQGLISSEIPLQSFTANEQHDQEERKIINQGQKEEPKETKTPDVIKQKKTEKPQSRVFLLLNLLALFLFLGGLAYFAYQQFGQAIISLAYPSTPTAPNSILSYQGRLTNTAQSPISEPTAMTYTLYDDVTGGNVLWSSNTCTIDPDQDGIFNANLGAGVGTGADNENCGGAIGEDVFTLHNNVWLEVAVGAETLTPRQPIRTVAYALNAATLQGLPVTEVASNSTILMMNSAGEVVLGTDNPIIKTATGSSGMTIEANQITIQTTTSSNGDIILAPDGDGEVQINSADLVLNDGTIYSNSYAPASNSANISFVLPSSGNNLNFLDNSGLSTLVTITGDGQMGIGTDTPNHALDVAGNLGLNTGAYINWGATDGETGYGIRDSGGTLQYKSSGGTWADIGSGTGTGDSFWTSSNGALYANNSTLDFLIGSNATASAKFAFTNINSGKPTFSMANQASAFDLLNSTVNALDIESGLMSFDTLNSRVGIGTTTPGALLGIASASSTRAQLNLVSSVGTDPTAPNNGDLWWNGTSLNFYDGSSTVDLLAGGGDSLWVDAGTYIYPLDGKPIGDPTSGGTNKVSGLYLADSGPLYFGTDNDINFSFSGSTLATTLGLNSWNIANDLLYLDGATNQIGIGTTSPLATLDVRALDTDMPVASFSGATNLATLIVDQSGSGDIFTASASGETQFVITKDGNVGIGINDPTSRLQIAGAASTITNDTGDITIDAASGNISFAGDNIININDGLFSGSIGVGTTTPARRVEIVDASNPQLRLTQTEDSIYADFNMNANGDLIMNVDGITNQFVLDNGGNVSIGLTNPDEKLTVSGSINAEKYYDFTNKNYFLDPAAISTSLKTAGDAHIGGDVYVEGGEIFITPMSLSTSTTEGTVYYDDDVDHLYLYDGNSTWHRIALDMTKYSTYGTISNQDYLQIAHNQNSNDLTFTVWIKDAITNLWRKIDPTSSNIDHDMANEFNPEFADKTKVTEIKLAYQEDNLGDGSDGAITIATDTNGNTTPIAADRVAPACPDFINFNVTALTSNTATLTGGDLSCIEAGDEVLLINLQGTPTSYGNVGNYETLRLASDPSGSVVTFTTNKTKYYGDGATDDSNLGTATGTQRVMLQRVPNYTDVTVNAGVSLYPSDWNEDRGGVIFFRATGSVNINGTINANGTGYLGGTNSGAGYGGWGGESFCQPRGSATTAGAGGNAAYYNATTYYQAALCGGGAGQSSDNGTAYGDRVGTINLGGAGGAGGAGNDGSTDYDGRGGGGAGGGYGSGGVYGAGAGTYESGSTNSSGNGGTEGDADHAEAGGGGGGGTYGDAELTKLMFGSGGGAGGTGEANNTSWYTGGSGGAGGGIVYIAGSSVTVNGNLQSHGDAGTGGNAVESGGAGSGGGGAGGSIKVVGASVDLGTAKTTTTYGAGGTAGAYDGGNGGYGRIAVYSADPVAGTSTPSYTADTTFDNHKMYKIYTSQELASTDATAFNNISWTEDLNTYGEIQLQTRSGATTDSTDGSWEGWTNVASTSIDNANSTSGWSSTNATLTSDGIARNVNYFEDEDESTTSNMLKLVSSASGGYSGKTISSVDLSVKNYVTMWIRSSIAGESIKLGLGEASATELEHTFYIDQVDTWQKVYWDISAIATTSRDAITQIRVTSNPTSNTVYFDNINAVSYGTTNTGTAITSTTNDYIQYRAILSTSNIFYSPTFGEVHITYTDTSGSQVINDRLANQNFPDNYDLNQRLNITKIEENNEQLIHTNSAFNQVYQTPYLDHGNGADGAIVVSSDTDINITPLASARLAPACPDAINFNVLSLTANSAKVHTNNQLSCLAPGDEVLLINLQGTPTSYGNVGHYETLRIESIAGDIINFTTSKTKYYGDGATDDSNLGTDAGTQRVMLQRVPNYTDVTVNAGVSLYPSDWNEDRGGVIFFRATGSVNINGTINANGTGYRGGVVIASYTGGGGGESFCQPRGSATTAGAGGNAAEYSSTTYYQAALCGGGAGQSSNNGTAYGDRVGTINLGGAGGGGGASQDGTTAYDGKGGGGAGGGYGTGGIYGQGEATFESGSTNSSGNGGTEGGSDHTTAGGGGGGGTYGDAELTKLMFGSGGGAGGYGEANDTSWYAGGVGGAGGGIVYIAGASVTVNGNLQSHGDAGTGGNAVESGGAGSGGGGAGGSIKVVGDSVDLGGNSSTGVYKTTTTYGAGGTAGAFNGGNGGYGRIAVYSADPVAGTSYPNYATTSVPSYHYGIYVSDEINTPNAVTYEKIKWLADLKEYGQVVLQTRSGKTSNSTDESWSAWENVGDSTTITIDDANDHTLWTAGSDDTVNTLTIAEGDTTRDENFFEDDNEATATNIAKVTVGANDYDYLERRIGTTDLSGYDSISLWVKSSEAGNVVKVGFGESLANEHEQLFHIDVANQWQKIYWDISNIPDHEKNEVRNWRLTATDSNFVFYFDDLQAEKHLANAGGDIIHSPAGEYIQYRIITTTTRPGFFPEIFNVNIDWNNGYKVEQTNTNTVRLYNYTGDEQEMRLDVIVFGADLAEWYTVNDESIGPADLVAITGEMDDYGVPILRKADKSNDPMLVGVISTQAGTELGIKADDRRLLALDGRVPVKIDPTSSAIEKGDHLTSSGQPGLARKAKPGELSIGRSFESWNSGSGKDRVLAIVNDAMATPSFGQQLVDGVVEIADLLNLKIKDNWEIVNYDTNETVKSAAALAQAIIGKLKVGQMEVSEIKAPEGEKLSLEGSNIAIQLDDPEASGSSALGKLIIQNQDGEVVASFDSEGNASISGQLDVAGISRLGKLIADEATFGSIITEEASISGSLIANNIQAESARLDYIESKLANLENASVSGTLYADNIQTNNIQANVISGLEERLSSKIAETLNQPSLLASLFDEQAQQTDEYLQQLQQELSDITAENEDTTLTEIDQNSNDLTLIADSAFVEQYFEVNGNAFIADSLKLGQSLMVGEDTIVGNGFISYQPQLAEGEEDFTFSIQPTGVGKLSLMAGLMQLDSHGFVSINGDLKVAGVLEVEENLKVKDTLLTNLISANKTGESIKVQLASIDNSMEGLEGEDLTVQKSNFEFINENNTPVASFSSVGDLALTGSLRLSQNIEIASDSGEVVNSRSAGQAILEAGKTEITIISDKIEENSMIYVTPMNSTNNQVLYVKNKTTDSPFTPENEAQFTVAIDYALGHNVVFNWWIIQLN